MRISIGVVRKLLLGMPYLQWLSLSFLHIAPGEVDFAMPLRREITFDGKSVQAGPIGSLLDFAGGAAPSLSRLNTRCWQRAISP
jgi:acyl-coenzyme A thioesterase PaaI-like protein